MIREIRVETPKFVCFVVVDGNNKITGAAPILNKFKGQQLFKLERWLQKMWPDKWNFGILNTGGGAG